MNIIFAQSTENVVPPKIMNKKSSNKILLQNPWGLIDMSSVKRVNENNLIAQLKQDNMPCIIPDIKEFNMPNAAKWQPYIYQMPNLWPPDSLKKYYEKKFKIKK